MIFFRNNETNELMNGKTISCYRPMYFFTKLKTA